MVTLFTQGRYSETATLAQAMTVRFPKDAVSWKVLGAVLRRMGQSTSALAAVQKAVALSPGDAEAHNNLGTTLEDLHRLSEAEVSYGRALQLKPDYAEAHFNLGNILRELGRFGEAEASFRRALQVKPAYAEAHNNLGAALQQLGCLDEAEVSYRRALQIKPDYAEAHNNLGNTLRSLGRPGEAEVSFRRALQIEPALATVHFNLGNALSDLGRLGEAEAGFRRALQIKPDDAEAHNNLGNTLRNLDRLGEAEASYGRALQIKPATAEAHNNLGVTLQNLGRFDQAEAHYRRALEIKPDYADAHSNFGGVLMELGKIEEAEQFLNQGLALAPAEAGPLAAALFHIPYQPQDPRFKNLEHAYARRGSLALEERVKLNFAMGKAMETIGQYDRSFSAYEEGNRLYYERHPFDEATDEGFLEQSRVLFTAELFKKYAALADHLPPVEDEREPIFIVGMPRSGTTLIEQILASHSAVFGAGELTTLRDIAAKAWLLLRDSTNEEATLLALRQLGRQYLDQVWKLAPDARAIIDKQPGNYYLLGLIHLMLPHAKIIHCLREPMDSCFSCYALLFRTGHRYSYDLRMLGRHYLRYKKRVEHWASVLPPGRILDVRYEDNVADPEREARRMLDHLGLAWDSACLRFYETERTVSTASVTQVRKPMYSNSVARWKRFEKHLAPLLDIIRPATSSETGLDD
jgi:Flp pilus assembly protein TadD